MESPQEWAMELAADVALLPPNSLSLQDGTPASLPACLMDMCRDAAQCELDELAIALRLRRDSSVGRSTARLTTAVDRLAAMHSITKEV